MDQFTETDLIKLIQQVANGLYNKGYIFVANNINRCVHSYYRNKVDKENKDLIDYSSQLRLDDSFSEGVFSIAIKQLFTDTIAILYYNFVERYRMIDKVEEFFLEKLNLSSNAIIFAAQEELPESRDTKLVEIKDTLVAYSQLEVILKRLISIAMEYGLLLENNLLGGAMNDSSAKK